MCRYLGMLTVVQKVAANTQTRNVLQGCMQFLNVFDNCFVKYPELQASGLGDALAATD